MVFDDNRNYVCVWCIYVTQFYGKHLLFDKRITKMKGYENH